HLDQPVAQQLTFGTSSAQVVGWMAGGQRIIFLRNRTLFSVASVGGEPEPVFAGEESPAVIMPVALSPDGNVLATIRRGE
ncbi:MAG: hypothetical protein COW30_01730, partial [Rhodospirillales bacterium CG15_BIG_FIL_POST_REV_8_21_14_020_66_15]